MKITVIKIHRDRCTPLVKFAKLQKKNVSNTLALSFSLQNNFI